jgi:hypothetical protein
MPPTGSSGYGPRANNMADMEQARRQAADSLAKLSESLGDVAESGDVAGRYVGSLQNGLYGLHTVLQGLTAVSSLANLALNGFSTAVQSVAGKIGGLVAKVNPGVLDRYTRAFDAFQAQLGEAFLPVLQGLTGLVQTVANALAGLSPQGKQFIVFLAGAVAGLAAGVTAGGIFIAVLGTVVGSLTAGAVAAQAFGIGLDAATAGLAAVGAVIGAAISGLATVGSASAGGLAAFALASGSLEKFTESLKPFLEVLIGSFNQAGSLILPALADGLTAVMPALTDLLTQLVRYIPLLSEVVTTYATEALPELVTEMAELARVMLPLAVVAAKASVELIKVGAAISRFFNGILKFLNEVNPFLRALGESAPRGVSGNAQPPVTASYTSIEEIFKRSQESAIQGRQTSSDPIEDNLTKGSIINAWALAIGVNVAGQIKQFLTPAAIAAAIAQAVQRLRGF